MRSLSLVAALTLTLVVPWGYDAAQADRGGVPSRHDVRQARDAVTDQEGRIAQIQGELAAANRRLQDAAVAADQAYEAWNGARFRLRQARAAARAAERRAEVASGDVERQQESYADALVSSYEQSPELAALSSIVSSEGIETVVERTSTMQSTEQAMDGHYDAFRASATLAEVAVQQAKDARADAQARAAEARDARDRARAAADSAATQAQQIADQKDALIGELAQLQHTSKRLAARRQAALERAAAQAAAEQAAQEAAQEAAQQAAAEQAQQQAQQQDQDQQSTPSSSEPEQQESPSQPQTPSPSQAPSQPETPSQPTTPSQPPAPSGGAGAAVSFARGQIGEPYVWGAAGPGSWDCSGLTMGAWRAGGTYLPHYSVAQYEQSTPISVGSLRPGDLVFWGSSSSPSSIYHVAIYAGGGQIIHAPRTGRDVTEESMYYWTPPNFYARP